MIDLNKVLIRLESGDAYISESEKDYMNYAADAIIRKGRIDQNDIQDLFLDIKISNTLYNNAANVMLPLNDEKYDALLVLCRKQNIQYPVGAKPVVFRNVQEIQRLDAKGSGRKEVMAFVPNKDEMWYFQNLTSNITPPRMEDYLIQTANADLIKRKMRNVQHKYDMCGTLDKCKFVLNIDAKAAGGFDKDPSVQILERDFFGRHIQMGIINPQNISVIASIKYDGVSVEGVVRGDTLISACTRGDTGNNEASDLTPALGGIKFPRATGVVDPTEEFGIKFEFIITRHNQLRLAQDFKKHYVNARNAVIGILGGLDARKIRDYLTPVPLETSLNLPRSQELEFLNKYYTKGIDMRSVEVHGSYAEVLYQLKRFTEEANGLRAFMNFQYDGIVVEYTDQSIRERLGKRGAVPEYSIAVKFPPMRQYSTFTHYTFSVGQTGRITPMAHFQPVEFLGAIHDKTTVHSLKRFRDLELHSGDKVLLTLSNDVIVYLTKAPSDLQPKDNPAPLEEFPDTCPACGEPLMMSDSGDTAFCVNFNCPERVIARIANFLAKLNIKDFSTETIRALGIKSLRQLINYPQKEAERILGPIEAQNFYSRIQELKSKMYPDYRILGAVGFTGISTETWRKILQHMKYADIIHGNENTMSGLHFIKGIGMKTIETIIYEKPFLQDDLDTVYTQLNATETFGEADKLEVRLTGFRDQNLLDEFNNHPSHRFNATDGSVINNTYILVVPHVGFESTKTKKAFDILSRKFKIANPGQMLNINWSNLSAVANLTPTIMTADQAYQYIRSVNFN